MAKGSSGRSGPTSKRCPRESAPSSAGPQASLPMGASSNFATLTVTGCGSGRRPAEPARRHRPGEPGTWEGAQRPARRAAAAAPTMTLPARAPSARGGGRQRRLVNPAITPMSLIDRPDQDVPVPAAACRMAFTAYPAGVGPRPARHDGHLAWRRRDCAQQYLWWRRHELDCWSWLCVTALANSPGNMPWERAGPPLR